MKVAVVGPDASAKGGIATVIRNFKGLTDHSLVELFFFTTWREGSSYKHVVDTCLSIITFPIFLTKNKIDLVHLHVAQNGSFYRKAILLLIAKLLGIPTIFHLHASQFDQFYKMKNKVIKRVIRFVLEQATGIVVLSESWKKFYESIATIDCQVIENAVYIPKSNLYNRESKKIISFGRLGKRKGTFDLITVAKKIGEQHPDYQFILYGDGDLQQAQQVIAELKVHNVKLGGWVTNQVKEDTIRDCSIHVLPSYQEGMPMAILETMAYGIPNISTNIGGIPQIITSGENGFLVEPGNKKQLETALLQLIEKDSLAQKISQNSYQTIQQNFSIQTYYKKWIAYYNEIESGEANGGINKLK
ncbi:MAG: glycosyltransferase family 4 protein [Carnobacterium sp.]|uniref:glycosyltransferase family 4 protein n=1 Tax=Carnobacterium sp. TaxID=48221 RepID=UPI002FCBEA31